MSATIGDVINVAIIAVEFIIVGTLWVWLLLKLHRYKLEVTSHNPDISNVNVQDPNRDIQDVIKMHFEQSKTMLPLTAAIASLDVLFNQQIISYFTLFPTVLSLSVYYIIFSKYKKPFTFNRPRVEMIKILQPDVVIRKDNNIRKRFLRRYANMHRLKVIGHINFLVSIFSFVAGTILGKSFVLSTKHLVFVLLNSILISYMIAFAIEVLFFKHSVKSKNFFEADDGRSW